MKAHRLIIRALILIPLLSMLGPRVFGSRISPPSCRVISHISAPAGNRHLSRSPLDTVLAAPARRIPTHRMHRLRGKRIHLDTALVLPPASRAQNTPSAPIISLDIQNLAGPNPPRGPPAPLSSKTLSIIHPLVTSTHLKRCVSSGVGHLFRSLYLHARSGARIHFGFPSHSCLEGIQRTGAHPPWEPVRTGVGTARGRRVQPICGSDPAPEPSLTSQAVISAPDITACLSRSPNFL